MNANPLKYGPDLLRGNIDWLLLSLVRAQPMYGYQLIKEAGKRSKGYFGFKEGTVYPALHRLENEGLIQGQWQELQNGRAKRYYYLTEKGEQVLKKKMAVWRGFATAVNLVLRPRKV